MHTTIDKTSDQDHHVTGGNILHTCTTYKEKTLTNHICIYAEAKQFVIEGKGKSKTQDCNPPVCSSSNEGMKADEAERIPQRYFPQGTVTCSATSLEPSWFGCQGWSVLGQSKLGARGRRWSSWFPLERPPPPDTGRINEKIGSNIRTFVSINRG